MLQALRQTADVLMFVLLAIALVASYAAVLCLRIRHPRTWQLLTVDQRNALRAGQGVIWNLRAHGIDDPLLDGLVLAARVSGVSASVMYVLSVVGFWRHW